MRTRSLETQAARSNEAARVFDIERDPDEVCLATWWRQATPATTYVRAHLPARRLPGQVLPFELNDAQIVSGDDEPLRIEMPRHRGVAIWQFLGDDQKSRVALKMQAQGVRTLMEMDDNYLVPTPALVGHRRAEWGRTIAEAREKGTAHSNENHRRLVRRMDGLIVSTPYLQEVYRDFVEDEIPVFLAPNTVEPDDWPLVVRPVPDDGILRIGYAGSNSHLNDYPLVKKALKWAARQRDVEVHFIGFTPQGNPPGPTMPWTLDMHDFRLSLQRLDVGVAPIRANAWSNGKSDLKALEYAMAGVMPIVQDSESFRPWRSFWSPWMPSTEDDWVDVIKDVVASRDEVRDLAETARRYVLEHRTIEKNIGAWKEAVFGES